MQCAGFMGDYTKKRLETESIIGKSLQLRKWQIHLSERIEELFISKVQMKNCLIPAVDGSLIEIE